MKHPKRFCVVCDKEELLIIKLRGKVAIYHCKKCGDEIGRVGDGDSHSMRKQVRGMDLRLVDDDIPEGASIYTAALGNPDILSDEQSVWQPRDLEAQAEREDMLETFKAALTGLTARQAEVLKAVELYGTHQQAAVILGVSRETVTGIMRQIEKKISKSVTQNRKGG